MERYSKIYKSKWQSQYSEEFKRKVCQEYISGTALRRSVEKKYNLGNSRLTCWLKLFGMEVNRTNFLPSFMPVKNEPDPKQEETTTIRLLKKQLEDALLEKELYRKMIEVAERDLKISIRKKSNTR